MKTNNARLQEILEDFNFEDQDSESYEQLEAAPARGSKGGTTKATY